MYRAAVTSRDPGWFPTANDGENDAVDETVADRTLIEDSQGGVGEGLGRDRLTTLMSDPHRVGALGAGTTLGARA